MIKVIEQIEVENPGILEVPEGKSVYDLSVSHFKKLIDKSGRDKIIRALTNLEVWNKNKNKKLSNWAISMKKSIKDYGKKDVDEDYDIDLVKIANRTSRSSGASSLNKDGTIRSLVARYVMNNVDKQASILDFGAGKEAIQTKALIDNGFEDVTAYDFGYNVKDGIHDPNALSNTYDVVFASNVINTASTIDMLEETLRDIYRAIKEGGYAIFNYPQSPRKIGLPPYEVEEIIYDITGESPNIIAGSRSAPVWKVIK